MPVGEMVGFALAMACLPYRLAVSGLVSPTRRRNCTPKGRPPAVSNVAAPRDCPCFVRERDTKRGKTSNSGSTESEHLLALSWLALPGLACGIGLLTGGL